MTALDAMGEAADLGLSSAALDAESATLGAVLCDVGARHRAMVRMASLLAPEDFAAPGHPEVWRAMLAVHAAGRLVDGATVAEELRSRGESAALRRLGELARVEADPAGCEDYARLVAERAHHREVTAGVSSALRVLRSNGSPLALVSDARALLGKLPSGVRGAVNDTLRAAAEEFFMRLQERIDDAARGVQRAAAWGVLCLDGGYSTHGEYVEGKTGGLFACKLYILAGVPAAGKTTLAWQSVLATARGSASRPGRKALVFSLEMPRVELMQRLAGQAAGVAEHRLERGEVSDDEWCRIRDAIAELAELPVNIVDDVTTLERIRARVLAEVAKGDVGLVVVDYLQLVSTSQHFNDGNRADAERVQDFKKLANEARVPIIAISAMTKEAQRSAGEGKVDSTGTKGAGAEYAADMIAFLVRVNPADTSSSPEVNFVCTKRRNGPTFQQPLTFHMDRGRFDDGN